MVTLSVASAASTPMHCDRNRAWWSQVGSSPVIIRQIVNCLYYASTAQGIDIGLAAVLIVDRQALTIFWR